MALRGKKPEEVQKRFKVFFYGNAGVGKTTAAIQFPRPYIIDTERGAENKKYVDLIKKSGGALFQTNDFDEILQEVTTLLKEKHGYKTLVIDSLTNVFDDLCEKWAKKLSEKSKEKDSDGMEFQKHRDRAAIEIKHLCKLLYRLDMNVVITSHLKAKWERVGGQFKEAGNTFDCYKKMDYIFDLTLEVQKRGPERVAIIGKTRVDGFNEGDQFPFCYEEMANRYGRESLERDAVPEILATTDQVEQLSRLIELMKIPNDTSQKWLDKANAERWEEMNSTLIQKCIDSLNNKLTQPKGE